MVTGTSKKRERSCATMGIGRGLFKVKIQIKKKDKLRTQKNDIISC